jgi:tetratricopeptide (TPR) repeat protein
MTDHSVSMKRTGPRCRNIPEATASGHHAVFRALRNQVRPRTFWLAILAVPAAAGLLGYACALVRLNDFETAEGRMAGRRLAITLLDGLETGYLVFLVALLLGLAGLVCEQVLRRSCRWPRLKSPARRRVILLWLSMLVSTGLLEMGALAWRAWLHRSPRLPAVGTEPERSDLASASELERDNRERPSLPTRFPVRDDRPTAGMPPLRILVIGESSGRGEPYHPWLSVGQIVAWTLEKVFPGRPIELDIWATGGATLASMHHRLAALLYRPDALIVFVGHNEFQGRYAWMRDFAYYLDDSQAVPAWDRLMARLVQFSPWCRLIDETREQQKLAIMPPRTVFRELVDRPVCTASEATAIVAEFRRRLTAIASYCEELGTCPIFVIPPSNDADYDPSRSTLLAATPTVERLAFARSLAYACAIEQEKPLEAIRLFRELVELHPEFAETHFRLARLLEHAGAWEEARRHYIEARERDAMPVRCPESLRQVFRDVAGEHPAVVLIDGPRVLENQSPHRIVGDEFFHDAQHPNLRGYAALAEAVILQLEERRALGWPASIKLPAPDTEACARHFKIDTAQWAEICRREIWFFHESAYIRYDPGFRMARAAQYERAAAVLRAGSDAADAAIPGWPLSPKPSTSHRLPPKFSLK